ncbi:MAG: filamentous hemagglutinin family protein [Desulfobacter sp.]|nr:MAG: filamentous hemagglutinin family protein [Desulfobacter sp.]
MKYIVHHKISRLIILFLCTHLVILPTWTGAKSFGSRSAATNLPAVGSGQLPVLNDPASQIANNGGAWNYTENQANHYAQITQSADRVVIKWDSFDVGTDAHIHFKQPESGTALNKITAQSSPSQILGQMTATGSLYLVNPNGIVFGKNSRTDLNSLVASSLAVQDFYDTLGENNVGEPVGAWSFKAEDGTTPGPVVNQGTITSRNGGRILLLGGNVENSGTISSEGGNVTLSAGSSFAFVRDNDLDSTPNPDYAGNVTNTGNIYADVGTVGIYGQIVRHEGVIRALSTLRQGSSIRLVAASDTDANETGKIITGPDSVIDSGVEELDDEFVIDSPFLGRELEITTPEDQDDPIIISHSGGIVSPGGEVTVDAGDGGSIYLAPGSSIDVSGSWITKEAEDLVYSVQLNSLELRDEFLQKNGILKGETVYFLLNEGVSIGNVSEHLLNRVLSAKEYSGAGGLISLLAGHGDVIVDKNASIDISGGGVEYLSGSVRTTKLMYDTDLYDISDAPDYLEYEKAINVSDSFSDDNWDYVDGFKEGSDAGKLNIEAKRVAFEGNLSAGSTRGRYQVLSSVDYDDLGYLHSMGNVIPQAGALSVHGDLNGVSYEDIDPLVNMIVIKDATPGFGTAIDPENPLFPANRNGETWLSDDLLSGSGLGRVSLGATTAIITEADTEISLVPGSDGYLNFTARRIFHQGDIRLPGGDVSLTIISNTSSEDTVLDDPERIELAADSSISTAGEQINNYLLYWTHSPPRIYGQMDAGSISLADQSMHGEGVVVRDGAALDVSGGYMLGRDLSLTDSGDAGSLTISGRAIALDGDISGYSMLGKDGGTINLHAWQTTVVKGRAPETAAGYSHEDPMAYQKQLILGDDFLDGAGFTHITLSAYTDLDVEAGATLAPSLIKQQVTRGVVKKVDMSGSKRDDVGGSSVTLKAADRSDIVLDITGSNTAAQTEEDTPDDKLTIGKGASVSVARGGDITVSGYKVDVSGLFQAPGGRIAIEANSGSGLVSPELTINRDARFYANGYIVDTGSRIRNQIVLWDIKDGGDITFSSDGSLEIQEGAVADVSGSDTNTLYLVSDDHRIESVYTGASEPGSITLAFKNAVDENGLSTIQGRFIGNKGMDRLRGGEFNIYNNNDNAVYGLPAGLIPGIEANGFDNLYIRSGGGLSFSGPQTINMGRGIRIDSPVIYGSPNARITIAAPWIQLENSNTYRPGNIETGTAALAINADSIDITGDIALAGFRNVNLSAREDIRLADKLYRTRSGDEDWDGTARSVWSGKLSGADALTLTAARIYPVMDPAYGTPSAFKLKAVDTITVLPSGVTRTDPIYSALGTLTLEAENIDHKGYLAAPLGRIYLIADTDKGRVYLDDQSVLTVAGQTLVNYGSIDASNLEWYGFDTSSGSATADTLIETYPETVIDIRGYEVIGQKASVIDISGGGGIFGYTFQGSTKGSKNPLSDAKRYVILPGGAGNLPGEAIYLTENGLVPQGLYTLLPESYAFMDGAVVIEFQDGIDPGTILAESNEGYEIAVGFMGDKNSGRVSTDAGLYTLRYATDVRSEGQFVTAALETGHAGSAAVNGSQTNILNSQIRAQALPGDYLAGALTLAGNHVIIGKRQADLGKSFTFSTRLQDDPELADLSGTLYLDATQFSDAGLRELTIVSEQEDGKIELEAGSLLSGTQLSLLAQGNIEIGENAAIEGYGDSALIRLTSAGGEINLAQGAHIRSDRMVSIDTQTMAVAGEIETQHLAVASDRLYLSEGSAGTQSLDGLVLDQGFWSGFKDMNSVSLTGRSLIGFKGHIELAATSSIVLDSPEVVGLTGTTAITAGQIALVNSGTDTAGWNPGGIDPAGKFTALADEILIGQGNIQLSNYQSVDLNARGNLVFRGQARVETEGDIETTQGVFSTSNTDLNISAARVTGTYISHADGNSLKYDALDFKVDAGIGNITITGSGAAAAGLNNIGGKLSFVGGRIENSGTVDLPSGVISFRATGNGPDDGVFMMYGAQVSANGSEADGIYYDGGIVYYEADNGNVKLASGSVTDVSADPAGADGGLVWINAAQGSFSGGGKVLGTASNGTGGSFWLDAGSLEQNGAAVTDISSVLGNLNMAGADNRAGQIDLRVRSGDAFLADNVAAHEFRLSLDQGSLSVDAQIDASRDTGNGRIELYAGNDLTLSENTRLVAQGLAQDSPGGKIILGNATKQGGSMDLGGAVFDVSTSDGTGGSIYLRVSRNDGNDGINLVPDALFTGASSVVAEGVMFHDNLNFSDWKSKANGFMAATGGSVNAISIIPGMEYQTQGDLALSGMDMTGWRFGAGKTAGAVTFRAGGDLSINGDIVDHPTDLWDLPLVAQSTTISLAAGSTLSSSDIFAVDTGTGHLSLGDKVLVYTESGNIHFASGGTTTIGNIEANAETAKDYMTYFNMNYNLGSYSGEIRGYTGEDLVLDGGVVQTATGDIELNINGGVKLVRTKISGDYYTGSIRTTGRPITAEDEPELADNGNLNPFWVLIFGEDFYNNIFAEKRQTLVPQGFHNGGNIDVNARGDIKVQSVYGGSFISQITDGAWDDHSGQADFSNDTAPGADFPVISAGITEGIWSANFNNLSATQGIAAMGGGNVNINTAGAFFAAAGTFGAGSLTVAAQGEIDGRFLNKEGTLELSTMDNFGMMEGSTGQVIEVFDSQVQVTAQGDLKLGSAVNPTITGDYYGAENKWDLQYSQTASLSLSARTGSVTLTGNLDDGLELDASVDVRERVHVLPPSLYINAGSDIVLGSTFYLPPIASGQMSTETGQITLYAGRDIRSQGTSQNGIYLYNMHPDDIYGNHDANKAIDVFNVAALHGNPIDREQDYLPSVVSAGNDISNIILSLPRAATITAGNDIIDTRVTGQNIRSTDITSITAGHDIMFTTEKSDSTNYSEKWIMVGGPGRTIVQAGNAINLGTSLGIQSIGDFDNPALSDGETELVNDLVVIAGIDAPLELETIRELFLGNSEVAGDGPEGFVLGEDGLMQVVDKIRERTEAGDKALADQILADARQFLIAPLWSGASGTGDISLINSKIYSSGGAGNIYAIAAGKIDVGVSSIPAAKGENAPDTSATDDASGLYTTSGGGIHLLTYGDVNVNESRVMTFDGGDIVVWSDQGNINAGMGSKAATASGKFKTVEVNGVKKRVYIAPAVGSGIRATATDIERAGDLYIIAPSGIIDAGEAGIAGQNVTLIADQVINAQNIEASGNSFGFTKPSESSANVSGLSGGSGLADAAMLDEESSALASSQDRMNEETPEGYSMEPRWVDVEVVGFEEDEEENS